MQSDTKNREIESLYGTVRILDHYPSLPPAELYSFGGGRGRAENRENKDIRSRVRGPNSKTEH